MKIKLLLRSMCSFCLALTAFSTQASTETVTSYFANPSVSTVNSYNGLVNVTVSGVGQSLATLYNDAFYVFADGNNVPFSPARYSDWYHLDMRVGGVALTGGTSSAYDIVQYITPSGLPAYNPSHVYSFTVNVTTPGTLAFGVSDGGFYDNTGFYEITVSQVPVPAAIWLFAPALAGLSAMTRRKS